MPGPSTPGRPRVHVPTSSWPARTIPPGGTKVKKSVTPARLGTSANQTEGGDGVTRQDAHGLPVNAEQLFLAHLEAIEQIAEYICRSHHIPDYADDFAGDVRLRLIERNYEIIRKFEGRAQFRTYLTTIMHHLFYQYRVKEWGKWRPSAEAKRLGRVA